MIIDNIMNVVRARVKLKQTRDDVVGQKNERVEKIGENRRFSTKHGGETMGE